MQDNGSIQCSPDLTAKLGRAVEGAGYLVRRLSSGAGHDTVIMSEICPVAMLFVRCKGGISHNPAESVQVEDVTVAIEVMGRFLEGLDAAV
jgi:allantoate deiminase